MPDFLTSAARSEHMRKITSKDTSPELVVRSLAHKLGFRFRLHRRDLPGTPDLVFPGLRKVIFVHGCFWHLHPGCHLARIPKTRVQYWKPKLERNRDRDVAILVTLRKLGWKVLVIWECETAEPELLARKLKKFLRIGSATRRYRVRAH
jgi:DNA mismatch endonuclease (patch repair protein)